MKICVKGEMLFGKGRLTATMPLKEEDRAPASSLMPVLGRKDGRILCNAYSTGVEVCHAMVHSHRRSRLQVQIIVGQMEL